MEKDGAFSNDFPTQGVELTRLLLVSDYACALAFYRDVLGATVIHELAPTLCELDFAGSQLLLVTPSEPPANGFGRLCFTFPAPARSR